MDLTLKINADASQAKSELKAVEQGIKGVETASKSTAPAVTKVTESFSQFHARVGGDVPTAMRQYVVEASRVEAATAALAAKTAVATQSFVTGTIATGNMTAVLSALGLGASTTTLAMSGLGAAAVLAAGALGAAASLVLQSTKYYFDHASAMQGARTELDRLNDSWHTFQYLVGEAVLGQSAGSAVSGMRLIEGAVISLGVQIQTTAAFARNMYGSLLPGANAQTLFDYFLGSTPPKRPPPLPDLTQQRFAAGLDTAWGQSRSSAWLGALGDAGPSTQNPFAHTPAEIALQNARLRTGPPSDAAQWAQDHSYWSAPGVFSNAMGYWTAEDGPIVAPGVNLGNIPRAGSFIAPSTNLSGMVGLPYAVPGNYQTPPFSPSIGSGLALTALPFLQSRLSGIGNSQANGYLGMATTLLGSGPGSLGLNGGAGIFGGSAGAWGGMAGAAGAGMAGVGLGLLMNAKGTWANVGSGALTGAGVGTMIMPGIGTAIGAGVGAVGGYIKSLFGEAQGHKDLIAANEEIAKLKDNLISTYGSLDNLDRKANVLGYSFKNAWGAQNIAGLQSLQSYATDFEADQERLQKALDKYGFTWEELGPKLQGAKITDFAEDLQKDMEVLLRAGVDTSAVFTRMSGDFSKLAQMSVAAGIAIPASLKPVLQHLVDMGLLVDATGQKFKDLSGINFADDPVVAGLNKVVDRLDALLKGLGLIPDEAKKAAKGLNDAFQGVKLPDFPGGGNAPADRGGTQAALGGFVFGSNVLHFRQGGEVPAILHQGEFVLRKSAVDRIGTDNLRRMNAGGGVGSGVSINVTFAQPVFANDHTSMAQFADFVSKVTIAELKRQGVRLPAA